MAKIILDTMSLTEVGLIVYERSIGICEKISPLLNHKQKEYARIMIRKGNVKTYFKPITIENYDITFHLIPNCLGKADLKKYGARVLIAGEFRYKGDRFYSLLIGNCGQISIYTTHFLERYVERHLGDDSPINADTFIKYLMETDGVIYGFDEGVDNKIQWATSIGNVCGCVLHPRVLFHKTFIDNSTIIKGKKKEANDKGNVLMNRTVLNRVGNRTLPYGISKYFNFKLE